MWEICNQGPIDWQPVSMLMVSRLEALIIARYCDLTHYIENLLVNLLLISLEIDV